LKFHQFHRFLISSWKLFFGRFNVEKSQFATAWTPIRWQIFRALWSASRASRRSRAIWQPGGEIQLVKLWKVGRKVGRKIISKVPLVDFSAF